MIAKDAIWLEPQVVGGVSFAELTGDGRFRHPSRRGLRPDKTPSEVGALSWPVGSNSTVGTPLGRFRSARPALAAWQDVAVRRKNLDRNLIRADVEVGAQCGGDHVRAAAHGEFIGEPVAAGEGQVVLA
ncbi:hypothetical protein OHB12_13940 [Nocardia sp. NBC_01730]|uniref:ATP dependent DNA ligase n=1 Tax=Nocardia sp. NBC_01730 TaxID=2975998 RepID=UPI002E13C4C8|nr:hypothetical protein OHB12_13940 [Nocardia sp. NBC_01730]